MNYKKMATLISLAVIYLSQPATALAYSSSSNDTVFNYFCAFLALAAIFGLCIIVLKLKQNYLVAKLVQLKIRDPGFNEQMFKDKVSALFFEIQHAWINRDMEPVRIFLSDTVFSHFISRLEKNISNHTFNKLDELSLVRADIIAIRFDDSYDNIDVWITAKAKSYTVDDSGCRVSGSTALKKWDEKWSFIRPAKVINGSKENISRDKCPNCTSPVQIYQDEQCEYCHTRLKKYEFDWLLSNTAPMGDPNQYNSVFTGTDFSS